MTLSIIIVNYHVKDELFACLKSIFSSRDIPNFEVIVVDNDEKPSIEKKLKKQFPIVSYVKSGKNLGYGGGNNLGSKYAKGEYLFILNPDTLISGGSIQKLIKNFSNKNIGIVAPILLDDTNKPYELQGTKELTPKRAIWSLSFLSKLFPKNKLYKDYYYLGWNKNKSKEVDVVPGTAFFIRRKFFEKINGFDEKYFLYFEEFDLCRKVKKLGYKILISPDVKIFHKWGASTVKNKKSNEYFRKSRFYYFRKNFGLLKSLLTESILRIDKEVVFVSLILLFAGLFRLYKLGEIMPFIPDIGWYYVSARDMILSQNIPLVGIASSHPWLHQGALWTYMLSVILYLFNFNPHAPVIFTVLLDLVTLFFVYFTAKKLFNRKVAVFSAVIYAASPLVLFSAQTPYHTSVIPFFTVLLMLSIFNWIKGKVLFFPFAILLLALLYNSELATFPLIGVVLILFIYGLIRKKAWVNKVMKPKILIYSVLSFVIPMLPMFLYDLSHGFPQTLKFVVWVFYRMAVFLGYPPIHSGDITGETWKTFSIFLGEQIQRFYFLPNQKIAVSILSASILFLLYKAFLVKFKNKNINMLLLFLILPAAAYFAARTNSAAYFPMFFPQAAIIAGYLLGSISKKFLVIPILMVVIIVLGNMYDFPYRQFHDVSFQKRINAAEQIISASKNDSFNVEYKNENFRNFYLSNYDYLTWWLGHGASVKEEKLKFYIDENSSRINIEKVIIK